MCDIEDSVNASLTFSAAQSTILAMSIYFLTLNKSQNWSKLNVIGTDDPFQNLDDIMLILLYTACLISRG